MTQEHLPCPHCGSPVRMYGIEASGYFMACNTAGCYGFNSAKHGRDETIAAWNTRAQPAGVAVDVEEMAKAIYAAHAAQYTSLRLPAWEQLGGQVGDAAVQHWCAIARAALTAALGDRNE